MKLSFSSFLPVVGALAVLGSTSCNILPAPTEDLTKFYVLSTLTPTTDIATSGVSVGIKQVSVAGYLSHHDIVVRSGDNEIDFKDQARWAEPVDTGVARVVRSRLIASPGITHAYLPPLPLEGQRDYDVLIDVIRCEGVKSSTGFVASFAAVIEIHKSGSTDDIGVRKVFQAEDKTWDGHDYGKLVGLLSEDVEALGSAVADAIPKK